MRSHYLPLFSRLGSYPRETLDRLAWGGRRRGLFEYWGHEASLIPVELYSAMRWRMNRGRDGAAWGGLGRFAAERRDYVDDVLRQVADRGPLAVSDLDDAGRATGPWWGWSQGKTALEWLFWAGLVTTAARRGFERLYDVPERVLPATAWAAPVPSEADAQRRLVAVAAKATGVATLAELRDYFRLPPADTKARVIELVEEGTLIPVRVEGWSQSAYRHAAAAAPRRIAGGALLSPFDSLVWSRSRTERLFDFHYRLAFYTPKHKRTGGYYVLPFLLGDRLVARVDLKADRATGVLRVQAGHVEAGQTLGHVAPPLADALRRMASWLGLGAVAVVTDGALGAALGNELR